MPEPTRDPRDPGFARRAARELAVAVPALGVRDARRAVAAVVRTLADDVATRGRVIVAGLGTIEVKQGKGKVKGGDGGEGTGNGRRRVRFVPAAGLARRTGTENRRHRWNRKVAEARAKVRATAGGGALEGAGVAWGEGYQKEADES